MLRFSHEEIQENAIVKIFLKERRRNSSPTPDFDDEQEEQQVTVAQLQAGTLEKLIEYLTNEQGELDVLHMHILFATYRTFTNAQTLIERLVARYRAVVPASLEMPENVRRKTLR